jgi:RNA polymerase sigma-70 factor (ECF subfamily)
MSEDHELLRRWRAGDEVAGTELVARNVPVLYRFFRNKVSTSLADLVQKTFVACVEKRDRIPSDVAFKTYLLGIARKELLMFYRGAGYERRLFEGGHVSAAEPGEALSDIMADNEQQRLLLRALRTLPTDLQIVIELFYWEDLPIAEVAQVVEIPQGTVKTRLHRARGLLRDRIAELGSNADLRRSTIDNLDRWAHSLRRAMGRVS